MKLRMYLSLVDGKGNLTSNGKLYYKDVETGQVPQPGTDDVYLWKEEDGYNGPMWHVRQRYMDSDGNWSIDLAKMIIDPGEHWQNVFNRRLASGGPYNVESSWYIDRDYDPEPRLLANGWQLYG